MHYRGKISGPILERIDIQKNVKSVSYFDLSDEKPAPSSKTLRERVKRARMVQQKRFAEYEEINCNAQMPISLIQKYCQLDDECTRILKDACDKYGYSARVIHKLLRMARTAADLELSENIRRQDILFVLGCRDLDRSNSEMYVIS
jgi:magnesium chelatase family protein